LETLPIPVKSGAEFRFPVQWVARPRAVAGELADFRGYSGTVTSGVVRPGDAVVVQPQGRTTTIAGINDDRGPLEAAGAGAAVVIRLTDDVDISRGDLISSATSPAVVSDELDVDVCWMSERPLRPGDRLKVRAQGSSVRAMVTEIVDLLDLETGARSTAHVARPGAGAGELDTNDIGHVRLRLAEPVAVDPYVKDRATGGLLLVDESSGDTLAAALVREAQISV
jgi:sulfate adenylyltransferase subunit 1 (EFTu-like GTPase family)